jgi:hypothetical protein
VGAIGQYLRLPATPLRGIMPPPDPSRALSRYRYGSVYVNDVRNDNMGLRHDSEAFVERLKMPSSKIVKWRDEVGMSPEPGEISEAVMAECCGNHL